MSQIIAIATQPATTSGTTLLTYRGHTDVVSSVAWSPNGTRLASAGLDGTVRVWLWIES